MKELFLVWLLGCSSVVWSQYTGGAGDGFSEDVVSLNLTSLSIETPSLNIPTFYSCGDIVPINGFEEVVLIDLLGENLATFSNSESVKLPELVSGFYLLVVEQNGQFYRTKIYIDG